jgi:hypothetical protein
MALPRLLNAVPAAPQVRAEIGRAIRALVAEDERRLLHRRHELAAIRQDCEFLANVLREFLWELRKAGFNPDEPRVPDGGQWTTDDGGAVASASVTSDLV